MENTLAHETLKIFSCNWNSLTISTSPLLIQFKLFTHVEVAKRLYDTQPTDLLPGQNRLRVDLLCDWYFIFFYRVKTGLSVVLLCVWFFIIILLPGQNRPECSSSLCWITSFDPSVWTHPWFVTDPPWGYMSSLFVSGVILLINSDSTWLELCLIFTNSSHLKAKTDTKANLNISDYM